MSLLVVRRENRVVDWALVAQQATAAAPTRGAHGQQQCEEHDSRTSEMRDIHMELSEKIASKPCTGSGEQSKGWTSRDFMNSAELALAGRIAGDSGLWKGVTLFKPMAGTRRLSCSKWRMRSCREHSQPRGW